LKTSGRERRNRIQDVLDEREIDLLVCALPRNVLMMSGYWPVVGTGVALAFRGGPMSLLVPEDEADLAASGWADEVHTFQSASLHSMETAADAIGEPLASLGGAGVRHIGYEAGAGSEPASYAAMHLYGGQMAGLLAGCFPRSALIPADDLLTELRARKTEVEIERIRTACDIAQNAFLAITKSLLTGASEIHIANIARVCLSDGLAGFPGVQRADGFTWCMSGPNSALAAAAYARSRSRDIENGDLVLVHCNSFADGYWTDITRTWCAGNADARTKEIFEAVFAAREAALEAIRPSVSGASVDQAARQTMQRRGFGAAFKHSTGHGVGFEAINPAARPRLHPLSTDTLVEGMIFNVEPAAYFEGYGGVRHCDMVAVTERGCELLTPFQFDEEHALQGAS
jgi:Xaa-Pro dipeptidase